MAIVWSAERGEGWDSQYCVSLELIAVNVAEGSSSCVNVFCTIQHHRGDKAQAKTCVIRDQRLLGSSYNLGNGAMIIAILLSRARLHPTK